MITEAQISSIIQQGLEGTDKFLVVIKIRSGNKIMVFIDGDAAVTIEDCVKLSRHIEGSLDRETEDFELQVSSSGADQPLKLQRQYPKHVGRNLAVSTVKDETLIGKLLSCDNNAITLLLPANKKKKIEETTVIIPFNEITESKIELAFK